MTIKKVSGGEIVVSHTGKRLTKPKSHEEAVKDLRRIEYFKRHSKAIVDPDLLKGRQFLPVVFHTSQKKSDQEGEKLDFPSTGKQMDLREVTQPEFPSAPYKGEPLASTFGNPRPSAPVKDGAVVSIQPSSGRYEAGSFRGEHGPDTQYKGSDYVSEDVKKKIRAARKSITIAGRKVVLIKGEGGHNAYLDSYPIDKDASADRVINPEEESQKRKDWFRSEELKRKQSEYDRMQRAKAHQKDYGDPKSITHDPNIAYLGRSIKIRLKKANKSIANLVLQYTQNQPLAYPFKPLVAYLVKDDKNKDKDENGSLKVTTFTGKHVGKSLKKDQFTWVDKKKRKEIEAINPHAPKIKFEDKKAVGWEDADHPALTKKHSDSTSKAEKPRKLIVGPWRSKKLDREIDEQMAMPRKVAHNAEKNKKEEPKELGSFAWKPIKVKKSEMSETTVAPQKKKTISPAGTIVQMIKEKMAKNDKESDKERAEKSVIGPFRTPEGKNPNENEYSKYLRQQGEKARQRQEENKSKIKAKKETVKTVDPNPIKGGVGDHLQYDDVDEKELEIGTKIEQEHVGENEQMTPEEKTAAGADIALDHLQEDDKYYTNLVEMERKAKENKKEETKKKKILNQDVDKSVIKERKLQGVVGNAEKMLKIREEGAGTPKEIKVARGQLRAYSKKLAAERKKNSRI